MRRCGSGSSFSRRRLLGTDRVVNNSEYKHATARSRRYLRINGSDTVAGSSNLSKKLCVERTDNENSIAPAAKACSNRASRRRARKRVDTRKAIALSRGAAAIEHNELDKLKQHAVSHTKQEGGEPKRECTFEILKEQKTNRS